MDSILKSRVDICCWLIKYKDQDRGINNKTGGAGLATAGIEMEKDAGEAGRRRTQRAAF